MTVRIEQCEQFAAPVDITWRAVEDISTHPSWMRDAIEVRFRGDQRSGVGTEFWCLTKIGPLRNTDVLRVTEWEPPHAMTIEHTGVVKGSGRFALRAAEAGGTEFCWQEVLDFPWWMGGVIGERCAKPILHRVWRRNLRRLKLIVEASA